MRLAGAVARSVLVDQAAELLGVSRRTVYYRIREGCLRTVRTRCGSQRVLVESIEALLREKRTRKRKGELKQAVSHAGAERRVSAACVTGGNAGASDTSLCEKSRELERSR